MTSALGMSLDEIIKKSKITGRNNEIFEGRGRGSSIGPDRRIANRNATRTTPYSTPNPILVPEASYAPNPEGGTKLYISNLDYGVSNKDNLILFSEVGDVKRYVIHYDKSGRSNVLQAWLSNNLLVEVPGDVLLNRRQAGYVPGMVRHNNGCRHARNRGQGKGLHEKLNLTAEDLDADLENYHLTTKQNK